MQHTAIEWCDMTWSPVTGCLHGCGYCYARKQARRFAGYNPDVSSTDKIEYYGGIYELTHYPMRRTTKAGKVVEAVYPFCFTPTFHRYRLDEPQHVKKPQSIFVCSMADLFGEWVPDSWIKAVFEAAAKAPWHRYLFLTKNPARYVELAQSDLLPNLSNSGLDCWYGTTAETPEKNYFYCSGYAEEQYSTFASIEPIQADFEGCGIGLDWVIVGAETGNRKGKIIPERKWIENIVSICRDHDMSLFMKNSLADIWGKPLIQEFPF